MKAALESGDGVLRTVLAQMVNYRCPTRAELKRTGIGALLNRKLARSEVADVAQAAAALLSRWRSGVQQAAPCRTPCMYCRLEKYFDSPNPTVPLYPTTHKSKLNKGESTRSLPSSESAAMVSRAVGMGCSFR
jgi:hypothetical protein